MLKHSLTLTLSQRERGFLGIIDNKEDCVTAVLFIIDRDAF